MSAERLLAASSVAVVAVGDGIDTDPVTDRLHAVGVTTTTDQPAATLLVAITDDYLRPALADLNTTALTTNQPWLITRPGGRQLWLGPHLQPGHSACWTCLAQRLRANRDVERFIATRNHTPDQPYPPPLTTVPTITTDAAATLITLEITKLLTTAPTNVTDQLITLDWTTLERTTHTLVRRPQCPTCGNPTPPPPTAPRLDTSTSTDTWRRFRHHVSPITGVVPRLIAAPTPTVPALHLYVAGNGAPIAGPDVLAADPARAWAWGADTDPDVARARALGEALEVRSATRQGSEAARTATWRQLGDRAVHPDDLELFSARQHADRHDTNCRAARRAQVPARFSESTPVEWTAVWSLTAGDWRYVPTAHCYYRPPALDAPSGQLANSNGRAAGRTLGAAVLAGLLELIERDSVAIWWANRLPRPPIDLDRLGDPAIDALRGAHDELGREVWALDVATDLGVPVVAAVSACGHDDAPDLLVGFGADLDVAVATRRAATEMTMIGVLSGVLTRPRPAGAPSDPNDPRAWWYSARLADAPHLAPDPTATAAPRHDAPDGREHLAIVRGAVEGAGLDVLVLDQTRPDIGLPVAQVIVPGLRYYRPPRLAPGRLYDVPVQMGWRRAPAAEEQLNAVPLLL